MAKIAIELEQALARRREDGTPGRTTPRIIAHGDGWTVGDVVCTCGPQDRPYEEQHARYAIAIVTPALPPLRPLSSLVARAGAGTTAVADVLWEEFALTLAERTVKLAAGLSPRRTGLPLNAEARVSQAVRTIDRHSHAALPLGQLARQVGLSPYHFLRTFKSLTGVTPHQYVLRARLRDAAWRLAGGTDKILDVALDTGFGDVSNFNRAFRAEFGASPRVFRRLSDARDRETGG